MRHSMAGELGQHHKHSVVIGLWRNVMRLFLLSVGVLAWIWSLAVMWIFAESGGALTVIAAGVFVIVAVVALGCESILKILEEIRDARAIEPRTVDPKITADGHADRISTTRSAINTPATV